MKTTDSTPETFTIKIRALKELETRSSPALQHQTLQEHNIEDIKTHTVTDLQTQQRAQTHYISTDEQNQSNLERERGRRRTREGEEGDERSGKRGGGGKRKKT